MLEDMAEVVEEEDTVPDTVEEPADTESDTVVPLLSLSKLPMKQRPLRTPSTPLPLRPPSKPRQH